MLFGISSWSANGLNGNTFFTFDSYFLMQMKKSTQYIINAISLSVWNYKPFLAIYFHNQSRNIQELIFFESPNKSVLVDIKDSTGLVVAVAGEKDITSLISTNIAIWNNGNKTIKKNNILKPIKLILPQDVKVVGNIKVKKNRDEFNFKATKSTKYNNIISIEWDFLKQGDGALIQLFHTGSTLIQTKIIGELDEQKEILHLDSFKRRYPGKTIFQISGIRWTTTSVSSAILVTIFFFVPFFLVFFKIDKTSFFQKCKKNNKSLYIVFSLIFFWVMGFVAGNLLFLFNYYIYPEMINSPFDI